MFRVLYSELSFAIHRFFLNGGTEAWVVRVGSNFKESSRVLTDAGVLSRRLSRPWTRRGLELHPRKSGPQHRMRRTLSP